MILLKILIAVCFRSGSKRLPGKAFLELKDGSTLFQRVIDFSKLAKGYYKRNNIESEIFISTDYELSINDDLIHYHKRPNNLSADDTDMIDVIFDLLKSKKGFSHLLLLQPTTPFRTIEDLNFIEGSDFKENYSYISISKPIQQPYDFISPSGDFILSKDIRDIKFVNGAYYFVPLNIFYECNSFSPADKTIHFETSLLSGIDIDYQYQFDFANHLLNTKYE